MKTSRVYHGGGMPFRQWPAVQPSTGNGGYGQRLFMWEEIMILPGHSLNIYNDDVTLWTILIGGDYPQAPDDTMEIGIDPLRCVNGKPVTVQFVRNNQTSLLDYFNVDWQPFNFNCDPDTVCFPDINGMSSGEYPLSRSIKIYKSNIYLQSVVDSFTWIFSDPTFSAYAGRFNPTSVVRGMTWG